MQRILGLDIGAGSVKAVALEASFRTSVVRAWRSEPVAPETEGGPALRERVKTALQALAADRWFAADVIVCSLPDAKVATHLVPLPFADARRVELVLPGQVEELVPFEPDEVIWDWHAALRTNARTEALVAVARRADVADLLSLLREVGVDPAVVTFSAASLASLFASGWASLEPAPTPDTAVDEPLPVVAPLPGSASAEPPVEALVDVGAERTDILLHEASVPRFARSVATGGAAVTRTLAKAFNAPLDAAESFKRTYTPETADPAATAAIDRANAALVRELRATFAAHATRTKRKVSRVRLCGGGAALAGLARTLSLSLGIPVEALSLVPGKAFPDPAGPGRAALALALALRPVAGSKAPSLTFRRGPFAPAMETSAVRGRMATLVAMAAVLLVLFGVSSWAKLRGLELREAEVDKVLCDTTKRILGTCETDFRVALGKLKGKGSPAASVPDLSAVEIAVLVAKAFPPGDKAILDDLDISNETLRLRGDAAGYDVVDGIVAKLQESKCFPEIKKGRLVKGKNDRIEFDLDGLYHCGAKAPAKSGS